MCFFGLETFEHCMCRENHIENDPMYGWHVIWRNHFFFAIYSYACLNNVYLVMYILSYMICCVLVSLDEMLWNPIDMSQHIYTLCWIKFTGFTLKNGNQTDNGAPEMSCDIHWMCCFSNNPQPHYQNHHFNYSWAYEYFCYFIYFCADF